MKLNALKKTLLATMLAGASVMTYAKDTALIIGVGKYQEPGHNLPGIEKDVDMARQIATRLGFELVEVLKDDQATVANIQAKLDYIARNTSENDRVLIYYSGHGSHVEDRNGDEDDGQDETLYVYDGNLIDDEFHKHLSAIKSKEMVVLMDSCHSGTATKSLSANKYGATRAVAKYVANNALSSKRGLGRTNPNAHKNFSVEGLDMPSNSSVKYLAIGAAQDHQYALATDKGSMFTQAVLHTMEQKRASGSTTTWQDLFNGTKSNLAEMTDQFSPNLDGNMQLAQKVIRFATPSNNAGTRIGWDDVMKAVNGASGGVNIQAKSHMNIGEVFEFTVTSPINGYLNVISVGPDDQPTVLFPNQYQTDNAVGTQPIKMPGNGKFVIRAVEPRGKTLVAAFVTAKPLDMMLQGYDNRDKYGNISATFAHIDTGAATRSLAVQSSGQSGYYASAVEIDVQ